MATMMKDSFNTYNECGSINFWRELCLRHGELRHYERGDFFFREGEVARWFGYIQSGTLKYVAYSDDGTESVLGFEFPPGFVADFPFSFHGIKARTSVIAASPCEILCVATDRIRRMIDLNPELTPIILESTEAVFGTVYDRYKALYTQPPQQRYADLISRHPNLFSLFSLRDIASFLKITPTHLSRLRKNI